MQYYGSANPFILRLLRSSLAFTVPMFVTWHKLVAQHLREWICHMWLGQVHRRGHQSRCARGLLIKACVYGLMNGGTTSPRTHFLCSLLSTANCARQQGCSSFKLFITDPEEHCARGHANVACVVLYMTRHCLPRCAWALYSMQRESEKEDMRAQ